MGGIAGRILLGRCRFLGALGAVLVVLISTVARSATAPSEKASDPGGIATFSPVEPPSTTSSLRASPTPPAEEMGQGTIWPYADP